MVQCQYYHTQDIEEALFSTSTFFFKFLSHLDTATRTFNLGSIWVFCRRFHNARSRDRTRITWLEAKYLTIGSSTLSVCRQTTSRPIDDLGRLAHSREGNRTPIHLAQNQAAVANPAPTSKTVTGFAPAYTPFAAGDVAVLSHCRADSPPISRPLAEQRSADCHALGRTRTCNLQLRRLLPYPIGPRVQTILRFHDTRNIPRLSCSTYRGLTREPGG